MPLGITEVGFGPGHTVLDGNPAPTSPPKKGGTAPNFRLICCGQTAGWIMIPLGTEVGLGPGHIVLHGDPAPPKGAQSPNFRPMSIVAKRSPILTTAEHLLFHAPLAFPWYFAEKYECMVRCYILSRI